MENFKPESKSKQESDRCRRLRVGLHDEFRADKLVRFTPELRAKGKVLSEEFGKLYTKEEGISFEEWFKKIKMFDRKEGVIEFRVLHEQERLNKLKDSKRIKRVMSEKNKQKEVIKKGSKPGNAQADNEITKNANPEELVDAKEPEEADPKKTKAEQKNQFDQKKDNGDDEAEEFFRKNAETRVLVIEILKMIDELPISEEWIPFKKKSELYAKQGELYTRIMDIFDKYDFAKKNPSSSNIEDAKKAIDGMATLRLEVESFRKELQAWKKNTDKEAEDELNSETEVGSEENNQEQEATPEPEPEPEPKQNTTQEDSKNNTRRSKYFKVYEKPEQLKKVLEGDYGKGYQFDAEGSSFEIDTCSIEDDTVTLNVRFAGRKYADRMKNCDSITMSVDDFENAMGGLKIASIKGVFKYMPEDGDEDFIAFGKNSEQKPEQASEFQAIRKKYHRLLAKIHVDLFPVGKYNQEVRDRSNDLTKEITNAFANLKKAWKNKYEAEKSNTLTGVIESAWTNSLNKFNELEIEVDEFLKNISKKTEAEAEAEAEAKKTEPEPEQQPEPEPAFKMGEADAETETETETEQKNKETEPEPEEESETNPEPEENEELEILKKAVEQARDQFVRINTEVTSAYLKIKRTLGKIFSKDPGEVPDVKNSYLAYQEKVKELKNFKLDAIKDKYAGISALSEEEKIIKTAELKKELGDLMLEFNFEEKINLYNARTTAGAEVRKDQLGGKALAKSAEWVNRYRKLNWKYKLAISGVLLAGGVGAAMVGATGVGVGIAAINIGKRIVGGAAAGMGTAGLMETIAREKQKKQAEKNKKAIFNEFDVMDEEHEKAGFVDEDANWEEKFSALEQRLNSEIDEYAQSLKNERGSVKIQVLAGMGVGVFVASGLAGQVFKYGFGLIKDTSGYGIVKEACGNLAKKFVAVLGVTDPLNINPDSVVTEGGTAKIPPTNIATEKPIAPNAPESGLQKPDMAKTNLRVGPLKPDANTTDFKMPDNKIPTEKLIPGSVDEIVDGVDMKQGTLVMKGDSVERIIINQKMAGGMSKVEAGKLAHLIATNPENTETLKKLSLIQPGERVDVDWEKGTVKVIDRSGVIRGSVVHNAGTVHEPKLPENHAKIKVPTDVEHKTIKVPKVEAKIVPPLEPEHAPQEKIQRPEINQAENSNIPPGNIKEGVYTTKDIERIERMNAGTQDNPVKLSGHESSMIMAGENSIEIARTFGSDFVGSNILANQLSEIKEMQGDNFYRMYIKIMSGLFKSVVKAGGLDSIKALGNINAEEYIERGNNPKVIELIKYCKKIGYNFNPKNNENMGMWTERVLKEVMKSCGASSPRP
jgi:hypothetical protein